MNARTLLYYLGLVCRLEAAAMLPPLFVALLAGESGVAGAFAATGAALLLLSLCAGRKPAGNKLYTRESFVLVAVCWAALAFFGAIPYRLSGAIPSFADALFESVSGFTTTAATVVAEGAALPSGLVLWRALSLWMGGMGVLVLLVAVSPFLSDGRPSPVLRAESPGPSPGKLMPRLRGSAMLLYGIYLGLTAAEFLLLALGGMPLFDSLVTAMSTAGTGGFLVHSASLAGYHSLYLEMVVLLFMFLCGMNYNLHYFLLLRKFRSVLHSGEWRAYVGILTGSTLLISVNLAAARALPFLRALRLASFQVVSFATTTGFTTASPAEWPQLSKTILFLLMFTGACAGSSGGGLKVVRTVLLLQEAKRVLYKMLHPRSVGIVRLDGKRVEPTVLHAAYNFFVAYLFLGFAVLLLVSLDNPDFESALLAVASCLNNIGAGIGLSASSWQYADFSILSKLALSLTMLLGRLELYPLLLLLSRRTWRRV